MKASTKLKREIMLDTAKFEKDYALYTDVKTFTEEAIDNTWIHFKEEQANLDPQDIIREFRYSGIDSNIRPEYNRHYDSKSKAIKCCDGSWVGYTFWSGGGKHGEPESIDYIEDAYDIDLVEEKEVKIIERVFAKIWPNLLKKV